MERSPLVLSFAAGLVLVVTAGVAAAGGDARAGIDPAVVGTIDAGTGSVTTTDRAATAGEFPDGNTVSIDVADPTAPLAYGFRILVGERSTLSVLPSGRAAVAVSSPEADSSSDDWTVPDSRADRNLPDIYPSLSDDPNDPTDNPDYGPPDTTWYEDGDSVAPPRDGMGVVSDAVEEGAAGHVVAAVDPPSASDAGGRAVPASLSVQDGRIIVSIAPPADVAFPISIGLFVGYDMDYKPPGP